MGEGCGRGREPIAVRYRESEQKFQGGITKVGPTSVILRNYGTGRYN
jgi:hypothetical protein